MDIKYSWIGWCREGNHDKVWAAVPLSGYRFVAIWGKRGKKLQSKVIDGDCWNTVHSKLKKGYSEYTKAALYKVYPEFEDDLAQTAVWAMLGA